MRIGIDATPITNRSGTGYYTQKLIEFLGRVDSENEYLLFCPPGYKKHLEHGRMFDYPNFRIHIMRARGQLAQMIWKQAELPRQVRSLGIDLFHFPSFIASLRIDIPFVVTVHDLCFRLFPDAFSRLRRTYYRHLIPRSVSHGDAVIADSESTRRDIVKYLETDNALVRTVHLGVDPVRFYQVRDEARREVARQEYQLPKDFILYVGTLEPRKNIPRLIRAYAYGIASKGLPQHLVIAGRKGWLFKEIFQEVRGLSLADRVHFLGHIRASDLAALYSTARVFAYPSLYEGFGLPCLEAMSCGVPVVASNRSSLPEVVGDAGVMIDPTSVDSIADALAKVCTDDDYHKRLSGLGIRRASHFSWVSTAANTAEIYRRVIEVKR